MGAGAYPAGTGPAGMDPVAAPSPRTVLPPQGAPALFLQTKGFRLKADGTFVTGDAVDQAVQLALGVGAGTIASAPTVGNAFRAVKRFNPATRDAQVTDIIRTALADLLSTGLIVVYALDIGSISRGNLATAVSYWNVRRQGPLPANLKSVL